MVNQKKENTGGSGECVDNAASMLREVDRINTDCLKWDALGSRFGDSSLVAMWVADMDFSAPQPVINALQERVAHGAFGYHVPSSDWKDTFCAWEFTRHGWQVSSEWIRYVPGVVPALYWMIHAMTEPGDACLVQTPVYYPFLHAVRDTGRVLVTSDLSLAGGRYGIDFYRFEQDIIQHGVKLFILCSPHNPVGRVWTRHELETVWTICERHGVFVLSDEIHQDIVTGNRKHIPTGLIAGSSEYFAMLTSASKTFNLASLENGILVIPNPAARKRYDDFARSFHVPDGNVLGYVAVEAAYRHGAPWLAALLDTIAENEKFLRALFDGKAPEVTLFPMEGTYLLWMDFRAFISPDELDSFMKKECGIAVDSGSWFGTAGRGFVRLNLATPGWRVQKVGHQMIDAIERRKFP